MATAPTAIAAVVRATDDTILLGRFLCLRSSTSGATTAAGVSTTISILAGGGATSGTTTSISECLRLRDLKVCKGMRAMREEVHFTLPLLLQQ